MNLRPDASFSCCGYSEYLNIHTGPFNNELSRAVPQDLPCDIWSKDHGLWQDKPDEISNRLGWLDLPGSMTDAVGPIEEFAEKVFDEGFTKVLLIGMGGSSLASEFFEKSFSSKGYPSLTVVDTTSPDAISNIESSIEPGKTLVVVSTKSGTTVETLSLMKYFYRRFCKALGRDRVGGNFVAITDPGSDLQKTARLLDFRKVFLNDPDVGGRFSALSFFGLVPASLIGMNLKKLLSSAKSCAVSTTLNDTDKNIPLRLGLLIGYFAKQNIDKMTIITSQSIRHFACWVEQLIAESLGKSGVGVLPVIESGFSADREYGQDRFFLFLKESGDEGLQNQLASVLSRNIPAVCIEIDDLYDFGRQIFSWEFATAVCGAKLRINPFDQPDVEHSKRYAKDFLNEYLKNGTMLDDDPLFEYQGMRFFSNTDLSDIEGFKKWLFHKTGEKGSYLSVQAFISPSLKYESLLGSLTERLSMKFRIPVTFGFGPRYLHSTGQMHKGDGGKGIFIQLVSSTGIDLPIPDNPLSDSSSVTFGTLFRSQSLGDYFTLRTMGRSVARIELLDGVETGLNKVAKLV